MKKTLIIIFLALSIVSQGQTFSSLLKDRTGEFNVIDYGVDATGATAAQDAIQAAVDAAHALYDGGTNNGGGTVIIPAGTYLITDSVELKSYVEILISRGAQFIFEENYFGSMWHAQGKLMGCSVSGGKYGVYGDPRTWTLINLVSDDYDDTWQQMNKFSDMYASDCRYGINLTTLNDGWINANTFKDIVLFRPLSGIRTRESATSGGMNENKYLNIEIQLLGGTSEFGVDSLSGERNQFVNVSFYDCSGSTMEVVIADNADNNMFLGCSNERAYTIDLGDNNRFISAEMTSIPWGETAISSIDAGVGIPKGSLGHLITYTGSSAVDITANPQIAAGSPGQIITILGRSDTNTLTLDDGTGLNLSGQWVGGDGDTITLILSGWSGNWTEICRSNN